MSAKVCVYCDGVYSEEVTVCPVCNELDGLLPATLADPESEESGYWTDEDKEEFAEEDGDWMDGDALASVGWGNDEDYGYYGDDF